MRNKTIFQSSLLLFAAISSRCDAFQVNNRANGVEPRGSPLWSAVSITKDAKQSAISALEKLRVRQKAELEETERLISLIQTETDKDLKLNVDKDPSLSTAVSILSGFDYGFVSRSEGAKSALKGSFTFSESYGGPPGNLFAVGSKQFIRNWDAMKGEYNDEEEVVLTEKQKELRAKLKDLKLNSTAIWERELADGPIEAPLIIKVPYLLVCYLLDVIFEGKYVPARFFLLETVARMPYFSYITMLHLYETLGFWRRSADMKRIHFAEEINEFRHLLIMESLGGDQQWWVRFVAQHSAIVYYIVLCLLWAVSPTLSYRFSELLETHAVNTYGVLLDDNEQLLKELPPSIAAIEYYALGTSDPFYAEFQTSALAKGEEIRRPGRKMRSLYDVFTAIREDEADHVSTMQACLDPEVAIRSPSLEKRVLMGIALVATVGILLSSGGTIGEPMAVVEGTDAVGDAAVVADATTMTAVGETVVAGIAAMAQKVLTDEQEGKLLQLGGDLAEMGAAGGLVEGARRAVGGVLMNVARFLAALL